MAYVTGDNSGSRCTNPNLEQTAMPQESLSALLFVKVKRGFLQWMISVAEYTSYCRNPVSESTKRWWQVFSKIIKNFWEERQNNAWPIEGKSIL